MYNNRRVTIDNVFGNNTIMTSSFIGFQLGDTVAIPTIAIDSLMPMAMVAKLSA
jgi:hypothetical protein